MRSMTHPLIFFQRACGLGFLQHLRTCILTVGLAAATALLGNPASAQERGDVVRGEALALQTCIACHGVRKNQDSSDPRAPSFARIAATPGMSEVALNVALLSSHRAMPNLVLDARERADIVVYILSLRTEQ
jgi:mono/diheme cytochrome c family protein